MVGLIKCFKMKKKKLNFIIPLIIYPFDVMVSLGQSDKELESELLKYDIEWDDIIKCIGKGRFVLFPNNQSLIRLSICPKTNEDYGVLHHEIFHCTTMILDRIGMKFILQKSDEAYAYLIGYLTTEIYKKI
jgi:hypothetical protein